MMDAPPDIALWVGSLVLTGVVTRWISRGDQPSAALADAEAKWKAELRADLKQLLEGLGKLESKHDITAERLTHVTTRQDSLEKRQDAQAAAHLEAIARVRSELLDEQAKRKVRR